MIVNIWIRKLDPSCFAALGGEDRKTSNGKDFGIIINGNKRWICFFKNAEENFYKFLMKIIFHETLEALFLTTWWSNVKDEDIRKACVKFHNISKSIGA